MLWRFQAKSGLNGYRDVIADSGLVTNMVNHGAAERVTNLDKLAEVDDHKWA